MKLMKKIVAVALVVMSLLAVALPAMAATTTCFQCGASATVTRNYEDETVAYDETKTENGCVYIRWLMRVPSTVECSQNSSHVYRETYTYWTSWQLMGCY